MIIFLPQDLKTDGNIERRKLPCVKVDRKYGKFILNSKATKLLNIERGDFAVVGHDEGRIYLGKGDVGFILSYRAENVFSFSSIGLWNKIKKYFRQNIDTTGLYTIEIDANDFKVVNGSILYGLKHSNLNLEI
jgi:hypothetical protein